MDRGGRRSYEFSDYEPQTLTEIEDFIKFLMRDLDYSRTIARQYFDAIQSYCDEIGLDVFDRDEFLHFRKKHVNDTFDPRYDESAIFSLGEIEQLIDHLDGRAQEFVSIQYLHCRRPGEVRQLEVSDINLETERVVYTILKQQYSDANKTGRVPIYNEQEKRFWESFTHGEDGLLFPAANGDLEAVRRPFREARDELGISDLPLKNLRHSRISHLRAEGWEYEDIQQKYTHHKHLSTLTDKYLRSVNEDLTEEELWSVIPLNAQ
jgi:integrase